MPARCCGHADDGFVESDVAGGAEELRVAEGEDAAVEGGDPVAVPARSGSQSDCGCSAEIRYVAVMDGVAERDDLALVGEDPVATARWCRREADSDRGATGRRAVEPDVTEGEDTAVGGDEPVARRRVSRGCRRTREQKANEHGQRDCAYRDSPSPSSCKPPPAVHGAPRTVAADGESTACCGPDLSAQPSSRTGSVSPSQLAAASRTWSAGHRDASVSSMTSAVVPGWACVSK